MIEPLDESTSTPARLARASCTLLGWTVPARVRARDRAGATTRGARRMIVGAFVASAILFVAFIVAERRATEPLIPFSLFQVPRCGPSSVISVPLGMVMFAIISFLPLFVQVVLRVVGHRRRAGAHADDAGGGDRLGRSASPVVLRIGYRVDVRWRRSRSCSSARSCSTRVGGRLVAARREHRHGVHRHRHGLRVHRHRCSRRRTRSISRAWASPPASSTSPASSAACSASPSRAALMLTTLTDRLQELLPGRAHQGGRAAVAAGGRPLPGRDPGPRARCVRGRAARRVRGRAGDRAPRHVDGRADARRQAGRHPRRRPRRRSPSPCSPTARCSSSRPDGRRRRRRGHHRPADSRFSSRAATSPTTPRIASWCTTCSATRSSVAVAGGSPVPRLRAYTG